VRPLGCCDTSIWVKTTVEISDALLERARKAAAREGTTIRALIEHSLRKELAARERSRTYRLPRVTFKGEGLHPDLEGKSWAAVRDLLYEDRGS
jgi:hypothetical protein